MIQLRDIEWQVLAENVKTGAAIYRRRSSWQEAIRIASNPAYQLEFLRPEPTHRERANPYQ